MASGLYFTNDKKRKMNLLNEWLWSEPKLPEILAAIDKEGLRSAEDEDHAAVAASGNIMQAPICLHFEGVQNDVTFDDYAFQ